jgi:hypothetical protein
MRGRGPQGLSAAERDRWEREHGKDAVTLSTREWRDMKEAVGGILGKGQRMMQEREM